MNTDYVGSFEYDVYLNVAVPLAWAVLMKATARHHYDGRCRDSGERGVINALFNVATWNVEYEKTGDGLSTHRLHWRDCDLISKVMEQCAGDVVLRHAIEVWLRATMKALSTRSEELNGR